MIDIITLVTYILMGLLGGSTDVIINASGWDDLKTFSAFRRTVIGAVVGFIYMFLHTDYGFPNFVMTFVAGYAGTDFIQGLAEKLKKK